MNTKRSWLTTAAVVALLLVLAWREARITRLTQAALHFQLNRRATAEAEIASLRSSLIQIANKRNELADASGETQAADAREEQARRRELHAWLELRDGALFRKLRLTPEQIEKFKNLSATHFQAMQDILDQVQSQGLPRNDPGISTLQKQENAQYKDELTDLLGPAGYQQVRAYEQTQRARGFVNGLAGNLYYTAAPLTPQQGAQLEQIMASGSYQVGWFRMNEAAVRPQVAAILAPGQLAAFNTLISAQDTDVNIHKIVAAAAADLPGYQKPNSPPGEVDTSSPGAGKSPR